MIEKYLKAVRRANQAREPILKHASDKGLGYSALCVIYAIREGCKTSIQICEVTCQKATALSRIIPKLENNGYIKRGPGADARSSTFTVTAKGRKVLEGIA